MSIEMVYLNPNISRKQADLLVQQSHQVKNDLINKVFENSKTLKGEAKSAYINQCLTIITALL